MQYYSNIQFFIVWLLAGVCSVYSYECDPHKAEVCKQDFVAYENVHFPFYGSNEKELDETCKAMNETFECLADFANNCEHEPCADDCPTTGAEIASLWKHAGLPSLHEQLCTGEHPFRSTYLENYKCLEGAAEKYHMCYNISQISQLHLRTYYDDPDKHLEATCCFFSWYQDCFVNATMETCGANATFVVSFALHLLTGHISTLMCDPLPYCEKPPLPDSTFNETPHLDKTPHLNKTQDGTIKTHDISDNDLSGVSSPCSNFILIGMLITAIHFAKNRN